MILAGLNYQLESILRMLDHIGQDDFRRPSLMLGGATIAAHVRHVIELLECMIAGYESGRIDYDGRKRDARIEADKLFAAARLSQLIQTAPIENKELEVNYTPDPKCAITSTYYRELVYNIDHAIHHMALMVVALREMHLNVVDDTFGKAPSTIAFERTRQVSQPIL